MIQVKNLSKSFISPQGLKHEKILGESGIIHNISWGKKAIASSNQSLDANAPIIDVKILALNPRLINSTRRKCLRFGNSRLESAEKLARGIMYGEKKKSDKISKK